MSRKKRIEMVIYLSKIIKELAQEFQMPDMIEQSLYKKVFKYKGTKEKTITKKSENGTYND